ncbi:MAG: hypothetical protein K9K67_10950 [Bacteriovoracaceae bacterium]|nr:hypothetical protein [Bacteriovoracaceae bacterium]
MPAREETTEDDMKTVTANLGDLLHKGSVKDIYSGSDKENLIFDFSDRYSVFDWGEMPNEIEGKGESLAAMGQFFFDWLGDKEIWRNWEPSIQLNGLEGEFLSHLKKKGLTHHALGLLVDRPTSFMVQKVEVPRLDEEKGIYNYAPYASKPENTLVPLEVIFRFGVPEGSSLLKRSDNQKYLRELGLVNPPKVNDWFKRPIIEFSTKLESTDRYINYHEAQNISGLTDYEFSRLHALTTMVALRLESFFKAFKIKLWDGKFEWAFDKLEEKGRNFMLVDSIGPDELRLSLKGESLSKEFLRSFYRGSSWLDAVEKAKLMAKAKGLVDWKTIVIQQFRVTPIALTDKYLELAKGLYHGLVNEVLIHGGEKPMHSEAISLEELVSEMKELKKGAQ